MSHRQMQGIVAQDPEVQQLFESFMAPNSSTSGSLPTQQESVTAPVRENNDKVSDDQLSLSQLMPAKRNRDSHIKPSSVARHRLQQKSTHSTGNTPVAGDTRVEIKKTRSQTFPPFKSVTRRDDGSISFAMQPVEDGGMFHGIQRTRSVEEYFQLFNQHNANKAIIRRFNHTEDAVLEGMLTSGSRWANLLESLATYSYGYPRLQAKARLALFPVGSLQGEHGCAVRVCSRVCT